jgi:iron(II)-dependent oxidoreductase
MLASMAHPTAEGQQMRATREEIFAALDVARGETFKLYDWLRDPRDARQRANPNFRPLLWHLGHIGAFEEWWLLIRLGGATPLNPRYQVIFDPLKTPREDSDGLPPREELEAYLAGVRREVERIYLKDNRPSSDPLLKDDYIFHLVLEHEYQHQETLSYLLQMLPPDRKQRPDGNHPPVPSPAITRGEMVKVSGGNFLLGASGAPFVYDNEEPLHEVEVPDFRLDRYLTTNAEYAEFVAAGGYRERSLWSEAGWAWKEEGRITRPHYWTTDEPVAVQEMFAEIALNPHLPVTGVSWHEATAYARFVGKRLPTEVEWEKAATWENGTKHKRRYPWGDSAPSPEFVNFNGHYLGTTPVGAFPAGASAAGCLDMGGNVWEWTSTIFDGYTGFSPYPYPEYSEIWFDGDHRILKGGSWMTRAPLLRASFRNFFRPGFRYAFAGFRCAAD